MDDKVKHKIKEIFLIIIVVILSISFALIYGLNPLNHNYRLSYIIGMGGLLYYNLLVNSLL